MKNRVALFAHYDKDNIIDQYVVDYLLELKKFSQTIIFISDGNLNENEIKKISDICYHVITEKHGEYDFGSWKRGFNFLKNDEKNCGFFFVDEIIFANDSCYLINSLVPIFEEMDKKDLDFWGIAESEQNGHHHIQSYFFVLNSFAFTSSYFQIFLEKIKPEKNKEDIIKNYEFGLSKVLTPSFFKRGSFLGKIKPEELAKGEKIEKLISIGMPFIKCNIFTLGFEKLSFFNHHLTPTLYESISSNIVRRIGLEKLFSSYKIINGYRKIFISKKIFLILIKKFNLIIKIFGIKILKIDLKK
jgi:lipopolysaccharide biosynthesis protein